jgi:hypothetical protein
MLSIRNQSKINLLLIFSNFSSFNPCCPVSLSVRFLRVLGGVTDPRATSLCSFPTRTSREVFATFSDEERMSTSHGQLAGQPRCLNPSPLCARPCVTSDVLARASVDLNQHQWYLAYHTPKERLLQQCVLHTKLIIGGIRGSVHVQTCCSATVQKVG